MDTLRLIGRLKFGEIDWRIESTNHNTPPECVPTFEAGIARLIARSGNPFSAEVVVASVNGK